MNSRSVYQQEASWDWSVQMAQAKPLRCVFIGDHPANSRSDPHLRPRPCDRSIPAKKQLAFVNDEPRLFDYLTVQQHLAFTARIYQVATYEPMAEQLLDEFELSQKKHALPANSHAE
jgi:hypothetical protein